MWGRSGLLLCNDAFAEALGWPASAAMGLPLAEMRDGALLPFAELFGPAWSGQASIARNLRLAPGPAGREAWFDVACTPLRDESGRIAGVQAILTESAAARPAFGFDPEAQRVDGAIGWTGSRSVPLPDGRGTGLGWPPGSDGRPTGRAAWTDETTGEHDLQALADALPALIAYVDAGHRYRFVNKAYEDWFPRKREDFLGRHVREILGEAAYAGVRPRIEAALRGERVRFEQVMPYSTATARRIQVEYVPHRGPDGKVEGFYGLVQDVSAQGEMEAARRESEAHLAAIFDQATVGISETDATGRFRRVNARFCEIVGRPREELLGMRMHEITHPEDLAGNAPMFRQVTETGQPFEIVKRYVRPDGSSVWVHNNVTAIRRGDGPVSDVLCVTVDLTEQRQVEAALREFNETLEQRVAAALAERKLLADVFENTDAMMAVADADLRLLAVNRAYADEVERLCGRRPRVGDRITDVYADYPEMAAAADGNWTRAVAGEVYSVTQTLGDPERYRRCYERRFEPLYDRDGHRVGAYQYAIDVTERLRDQLRIAQAESAQREADALYRAYFQNSAEGLFVVAVLPDGGFSIEEVNPAHRAALGIDIAAVRGRRLEEQLPPEIARAVAANYRRVVETGQVQRYRETAEFEGRVIHAETVLVPVRDEMGRITRIVGSGRDMTAQVQSDEALRQSQKMEAVGQLTGGIAHDFNNLLTPILGGLDILQRRVADERSEQLVAGALQAAERAKTLTQRLLAFARRQTLQPQAVSPAKLIEGMRDLIVRSLGPNIEVALNVAEDLPSIHVDPNQLELALLNLSVNARDAMPDGGRLTMTAEARDWTECPVPGLSPGRYLRLEVADTGAGMDEATLARAVEPFFSTKGLGKGTGLGLSMVHGLAAQSGGLFKLASKVGQGTSAVLWLPVTDQAPAMDAPAEVAAPRAARPATVLLVDDEPLVRGSTAEALRELGYEVEEAGTATEALETLRTGRTPDIVVTDHMMPGMTGAQLAAALRDRSPGLPVLMITGYAHLSPDRTRDLAVLAKPFRPAELARLVAELLQQAERARPPCASVVQAAPG
nr:PAS domain-containing protein [Rubellimicrobium arenae]